MLRVPKLRQPDASSCLPTCVCAVLQFLAYDCDYEEVRLWCHTSRTGCDADLASQGLIEAGIDAHVEQSTLEDLAELIERGLPPIIMLDESGSWYHAVVVCDVDSARVVVMDPRIGDYHTLSVDELEAVWLPGHSDLLQIGGSPQETKSPHP
jgi:ABC-type bacteriocin/lantibiotic exporter with double-glycine peptidase domain